MTLDFLEDMNQESLLDIIKRASIKLTNAPLSQVEVIQKQGVFDVSKNVTKIHNEFNKLLAFNNNVANIQKSIEKGDARAIKQRVSERQSPGPSEDVGAAGGGDLPDLGSAIDNLTQSLETLGLSGGGGVLSTAAGVGADMLAGRGGMLRTGLKVAGAAAVTYGAYKVAQSVIPSMLGSSETKEKLIPRAANTSTQTKKANIQNKNLTSKATAALDKPVPERKQPAVDKNSFSSRFADYIGGTFESITSYVSSIPERLASLGSDIYDAGAGVAESVGEFFDSAGSGINAEMAGGAAAAPYSFVESSIGIDAQKWDVYRNTIAEIESKGRYDAKGGSGGHYDGRYQMGKAAKADAGRVLKMSIPHTSEARAQFRADKDLQEKAFAAFTSVNNRTLNKISPKYKSAKIDEKLQILGYAHNQGAGGAAKWLKTGKAGKDGFGTSGTKYSSALASTLRNPNANKAGRFAGEAVGEAANFIGGSVSGFLKPVGLAINSSFGKLRKGKPHKGLDFAGPTGTPVVASAPGKVTRADGGGNGSYGNVVYINHKDGYQTRYAHLSRFRIGLNAQVKQGQHIGDVGSTGRSSGPHLHFEILKNGNRIDPTKLIKAPQAKPELKPKQVKVATDVQQAVIDKRSKSRRRVDSHRGSGGQSSASPVNIAIGGSKGSKASPKQNPRGEYNMYLTS